MYDFGNGVWYCYYSGTTPERVFYDSGANTLINEDETEF